MTAEGESARAAEAGPPEVERDVRPRILLFYDYT